MKNLKRVLCLALVLALCAGLLGSVSASGFSSFPDASKVTYTEAMDVLTNLGIIAGENGYLNPTSYVTREQAAKMIAYICLGKTAAEALSTSSSVFEDVAAGRWSAGYINYCVGKGIISGVGDTNKNGKAEFQPTANVTANQFVKMLLCAIGYGQNKELVGTYWATNTTATGTKVGAFEGTKAANYNAAATREEAMLYAFNIMSKAMTVSYSSLTGAYYSGSSPLASIASGKEYLYTLGYQVYGLYQYENGSDSFGRSYYQWRTGSATVSDKYYAAPALTYTTSVSSGTIYSSLGSSYAGDASYTLNGVAQSDFTIAKSGTASIGGRGILTLVYTDPDSDDVSIVSITSYLGVVTDVDGDDSKVKVYYGSGDTDTLTYDEDDFSGFDEDDVVLVTVADGALQTMIDAPSVTGTLDSSSSTYLKIDGTTYYKGASFGGLEYAAAEADYSSTCTFYFDSDGNVLGDTLSGGSDTASGYLYVTDSAYYSTLSSSSAEIEVQYTDGDTDVLDLYIWTSGSYDYYTNPVTGSSTRITASSGYAVTGLAAPGFYRYTEDSDGYVTLKAVSTTSQYAAGWTGVQLSVTASSRYLYLDGSASLDSADFGTSVSKLYLTSATELSVVEEDGDVTTLTGYSNIAGYLSGTDADVLILYSGTAAEEIYVFNDEYNETYTAYALYEDDYTNSYGDYYTFLADGEELDYTLDDDDLADVLYEDCLYEISVENGVITDITEIMDNDDAEEVTASRTAYFTTDESGSIYYADDCPVYDAADGGSESSLATGDYVLYALDSYGEAVCVYIVG